MTFPRYPRYKASRVEWLGEVPDHWAIGQSRRLFACRNERAHEDDQQLTASQDHGIVSQEEFIRLEGRRVVEVLKGAEILKHVEPNDFVISMRSFQGGLEWSRVRGCISSAYVMLTPRAPLHAQFFACLFKSQSYIQALQATTNLVRDGQAMRYHNFTQVLLPLVPLDEQRAIAAFLERETAKIDALVSEQERLIELLAEKRQAVISHAVTKGLDPTAPMKPSGIRWLDTMPAHWRTSSVARLAKPGKKTFTDGDWIEAPYITTDGVRLIQTGNIGIGSYKEQGLRYVSQRTFEELGCTEVLPGDVLICRLDGPVGRACLAPDLGVRMATSVDNAILKCSEGVVPAFAVSLFSSKPWLAWIDALCRVGGGFRLRVSRSQLGEQRVPIPPTEEQRRIADHLAEAGGQWDGLTRQAESAIELLQERRSALISAAVTGQIDVRNAVPVEVA